MGLKLQDELKSTPPKLVLSSLPSHTPLGTGSPWALTPPLQPMVSIPFDWEEAPGRPRPRPNNTLSPCKPKSVRCLELPPNRLLVEAKVTQMASSPTTVLDGPRPVRSLSHRLCFVGANQKTSSELGLNVKEDDGLDQGNSNSEEKRQIGPWRRWASVNETKWNRELSKNDSVSGRYDMDIEVKITRFRKSKGSLYKLSHTSSRVIENILECIKQIMVRRRKQDKIEHNCTAPCHHESMAPHLL